MRRAATMPAMRSSGMFLCLAAAVAFGAMAVFGKLAYAAGATVGTLLAVRFTLAAALLLASGAGGVRTLPRRDVLAGLALGGCAYALQAGLFFAALDRIDASLLSLLLSTSPAMVAVAAIALGRERADRRRLLALALASGGLPLVVAGAGAGALEPVGTALGLGAAVVYATYILVSDRLTARVPPRALAALVCTGAAVTLTAGSLLLGDLHPGALSAAGWGWLGCLAAISTVAAIGLFFAGLRRVGPTSAAILSTAEPLATVALAFLVFGETLTAVQCAGGVLVLAAVPALAGARSQEALSRCMRRAHVRSRSSRACLPPFAPSATSTSPTSAASPRPSATSASGGA